MTQKQKTKSRRVAVVSSRLPRELTDWHEWFHGLRAVCAYTQDRRGRLILAPKTAPYAYLRRAAEIFNCSTWLAETTSPHEDTEAVPNQDRDAVAHADDVFALFVRPRGAVHRLLRHLLEFAPEKQVYVAMIPQTAPRVRDELVSAGAVLWLPRPWESRRSTLPMATAARPCIPLPRTTLPRTTLPRTTAILWHCTRARPGPWPGESTDHHLDDQILGRSRASHRAADALTRIIVSRQLIASNSAIRGGHHVVSFSDLPWSELSARREFRAHRGRWDFEPFGIGICREWLRKQGARPVEYGDERLWESMDGKRRPFFQRSRSGKGTRVIDWTLESEWRHQGDLDLTLLPPTAGLFFVPCRELQRRLAVLCPWPVLTTDELPVALDSLSS